MIEDPARGRYYMMVSSQIAAVAGAVFGLVIIGRSNTTELKILGAAILLAGLYCVAVVPRALARRWRTPPEA
ncbi:hypothetical protein [Sphingomonas sp. LT1P40]|uniref:hypothetical protein n=1 Tax=Alteristakelama amylovorans TaxID=3096166 RepID=UPI002FCB3E34